MDSSSTVVVLPYGRQQIEEDDIAAVTQVLRSDYLTTGPMVARFEQALAQVTTARHAVSCSSGTAALHLGAMVLNLGPGDGVVVPAITFLATANAVRYVGAEVIFADVDSATGLMGAEQLLAALQRADAMGVTAKAVIPVHLNGQCVAMEEIAAVAQQRGLAVLEDGCHALGARYGAQQQHHPVGCCHHSDLVAFSFHPVKTVAMGEGGALTTNRDDLYRRLLRLRNHGMTQQPDELQQPELALDSTAQPNPWYYEMAEPGYNYRASDIHCALGLSQLGKLTRFVARRQQLVDRYDALLKPLAPTVRPLTRVANGRPAWHLYVVQIDFTELMERRGLDRAALMRQLRVHGIGTQVHYLPVAWQPYYRQRYGMLPLTGAGHYYAQVLSLPLFPGLSDDDVDRVVATLQQLVS
ncbi:MAG: UDP-4-amino-4,6-dideoxy-N-acetyl-beta-L-altrosamine transaminase [Magnetococcales bacterium]|nr:UDP-4-amino-4,6-dideoxy-N-acetyl-beta-L-altrosamine transaminase [Magnetococcales bacterium]